jgi:hypothetical protein
MNDVQTSQLSGHISELLLLLNLNNGYLASCSYDYSIKIWNKISRILVKNLTERTGSIYTINPLKPLAINPFDI